MSFLSRNADKGFDRLQDMLLSMRVGDALCVDEAVRASGLSEETCRAALEALTRVGLMNRETDGRFIRCTLDQFTA
ncbi:MAG: hypothetical protein AB7N65_03285 [Vicinamibacterales bacterium]